MANQQLTDFIRESLRRGTSPADIKKSLLETGWPEKDIDEGFLEVNPMVVPAPTPPPAPQPIVAPIIQTPSVPVAGPRTFVAPVTTPSRNSKRLVWAALIAVIAILILGSVATYAYIMKIGPFASPPYTQDNLLSGLLLSISRINTSAYSLNGSIKVGPRDSDAAPWASNTAPNPDLTKQFQHDYKRARDINSILGMLRYPTRPIITRCVGRKCNSTIGAEPLGFPASLSSLMSSNRTAFMYNPSAITDPSTNQPYNYSLTEGGKNFALTVTFETDNAISAIKNSYKYSATSTPINGGQVTFTKDSYLYVYLPSEPPKPFLVQLGESMSIIPPDASSSLSVSAQTDWSKSNADWKFNFSAKADLGDFTYNIDVDALRKNEIYYFRINHFPDPFLMFIPTLESIKGDWVKIDTHATSTSSTDPYGLSSLTSMLPDAEKRYQKDRQKFVDAITKAAQIADGEHLLTLKNPPKSEQVDGRSLYRYDLKINKDAIVPFYKLLVSDPDISKNGWPFVVDQGYVDYLQSPEFNAIFDYYDKNTSLTLWVDSGGFPGILGYNMRITPPDKAVQLKNKQVNLEVKLIISDINKPVNIEEPKDAKSINDLFAGSGLGMIRARSFDARRITDIKQIQNGLELFFNACNKYPAQLSYLTKTDKTCKTGTLSGIGINQIPTDPSTQKSYDYCLDAETGGGSYTLGAQLDDSSNPALSEQVGKSFPCQPKADGGAGTVRACHSSTEGAGDYCVTL